MTQPPRQFTLKDRAPAAIAYGSACRQQSRSGCPEQSRRDRPINVTFGPAGVVLPEEGFEEEDAAREWFKHVDAGRIGGA